MCLYLQHNLNIHTMKKLLISSMFALLATIYARGQSVSPEVLASAGSFFKSGNYLLDFTLGELSSNTYTSQLGFPAFILTEGFHQWNYDFIKIKENEEHVIFESVNIISHFYPNPVDDLLNVEIVGMTGTEVHLELSDLTGSLHLIKDLECKNNKLQSQINMELMPSGMYFLKIYDKKNLIKSTKIVKLK